MGALGWTPDAFWAATPHDFTAALDGWLEARGGDADGLNDEDVDRLRGFLDAELTREMQNGDGS